MTPRLRLRRLSDSDGTNMLEAAILTPLLLLLTLAIVDFSAILYVDLALENGVSQATRFGVTGATSGGLSRTDSIKAAMRTATPTLTIGDEAFAFSHIPAGGGAFVGGTGGPDAIERVTVTYTWTLLTPLLRPFFTGGQVTMQVASTMKNEGKFE
jgi:Flp pilus assembly protein TadG